MTSPQGDESRSFVLLANKRPATSRRPTTCFQACHLKETRACPAVLKPVALTKVSFTSHLFSDAPQGPSQELGRPAARPAGLRPRPAKPASTQRPSPSSSSGVRAPGFTALGFTKPQKRSKSLQKMRKKALLRARAAAPSRDLILRPKISFSPRHDWNRRASAAGRH